MPQTVSRCCRNFFRLSDIRRVEAQATIFTGSMLSSSFRNLTTHKKEPRACEVLFFADCGTHSVRANCRKYVVFTSPIFTVVFISCPEVNFGGHLFGCHAVAAVVALYFNDGAVADGGVGVGDVLARHGFRAIDFCDKEEGHIVIGDFVDAYGLAFRVNGAADSASRLDVCLTVVILRCGFIREVRKVESHRVCAEVVGAGVRVCCNCGNRSPFCSGFSRLPRLPRFPRRTNHS